MCLVCQEIIDDSQRALGLVDVDHVGLCITFYQCHDVSHVVSVSDSQYAHCGTSGTSSIANLCSESQYLIFVCRLLEV